MLCEFLTYLTVLHRVVSHHRFEISCSKWCELSYVVRGLLLYLRVSYFALSFSLHHHRYYKLLSTHTHTHTHMHMHAHLHTLTRNHDALRHLECELCKRAAGTLGWTQLR
jgi:hypothetical protein